MTAIPIGTICWWPRAARHRRKVELLRYRYRGRRAEVRMWVGGHRRIVSVSASTLVEVERRQT